MSRGEDIALASLSNEAWEKEVRAKRYPALSLSLSVSNLARSVKVSSRYYTQVRFTDRNFEFVRKFRRKDIKKESLLPVV